MTQEIHKLCEVKKISGDGPKLLQKSYKPALFVHAGPICVDDWKTFFIKIFKFLVSPSENNRELNNVKEIKL